MNGPNNIINYTRKQAGSMKDKRRKSSITEGKCKEVESIRTGPKNKRGIPE